MNSKITKIEQKILIAAKPEEVYEMYVNAKKHSEFTGAKATSEPEVGGKMTAWAGYAYGEYLELYKGKKIVQEWQTTDWPEDCSPSILEISLKETRGGTELEMVHSNVPTEQAEEYKQGWIDFYWKPLEEYFRKKNKGHVRV